MAFSKSELQKALIEAINRITISERFVINWNGSDTGILNCFLQGKVVSKEKVLELLHNRLKIAGRECYKQHQSSGQYPDHTISPPAFAYALLHNEFTLKEAAGTKFDHGETKETFIALYEDKLLEDVFRQLTTKQNFLEEALSGTLGEYCGECFESH
jgi:hypothetical protein